MTTEKELIGKIQELKQVRPNQNWVVLTKSQILGEEKKCTSLFFPISSISSVGYYLRLFLGRRLAYASLVVVLVLFGLFGFSQNSLPGDLLYPIKKITERSQAIFVSEQERPQASLELADRRLEELTRIVETNQVRNLAPAINEFQVSVSEAANNLSRIDATSSDPVAVKRIVDQAKNIGERAEGVKALGVVIQEGELNELQEISSKLELELLVRVLESMIADLENRTLTESQEEILAQMKDLVEEGKYSEALELYLINQ